MLFCWILKGETHKLFWPEQSEFVRMAARFGCTIIPISSFGEDEVLDVVLDLDDLRRIPFGERLLIAQPQIRTEAQGEVADQPLHFPFLFPKLNPGRLYILFGKPIYTAGGFLSRPFRTSCGISLDSAVQYL
jgi:hypothetical protein